MILADSEVTALLAFLDRKVLYYIQCIRRLSPKSQSLDP